MRSKTIGGLIAGGGVMGLAFLLGVGALAPVSGMASGGQLAVPPVMAAPSTDGPVGHTRQLNVVDCGVPISDHRLGYYLSGNGDVTADAQAIGNLEGLTQYRSLADGSTFPGYQKTWINNLGPDVHRNFVLEFKAYGSNGAAQTFTVDGVQYTVPAPNMTIQQRPGTTWPKAYGYDQVTSGQIDGLLARALSQLKAMPYNNTVNIQLASEFDTDHEFGTTENGTAYTWAQSDSRALAALTYVSDYFTSHSLPAGVTLSIGMGGFDRASFQRMHPANLAARFGVLQYNAYNHGSYRTPYQVLSRTWDWAVADLAGTDWLHKPITIAEFGTAASLGDQPTWINQVDEAVTQINSQDGPDISDANYFNSNPDWSTLSNPSKAAGLAALNSVASSAPFND